jgi:hypothetical protein
VRGVTVGTSRRGRPAVPRRSIRSSDLGAVIDDCIELAARIANGCIVMSRPFADQYEAHVGHHEFLASTRDYESSGRGLRVLDWP